MGFPGTGNSAASAKMKNDKNSNGSKAFLIHRIAIFIFFPKA
jgi:hypothetical protein